MKRTDNNVWGSQINEDWFKEVLPHTVLIKDGIRYAAAHDWCKGRPHLFSSHQMPMHDDGRVDYLFHFENKSDALIFKLIWGGQ